MAEPPQISHESNRSHHTDHIDIAARYLVYNVFIAFRRMPETSRLLRDIDEKVETLARAVERGWVEVFERRRKTGAADAAGEDAAQPNIDPALLERMYSELGLHP